MSSYNVSTTKPILYSALIQVTYSAIVVLPLSVMAALRWQSIWWKKYLGRNCGRALLLSNVAFIARYFNSRIYCCGTFSVELHSTHHYFEQNYNKKTQMINENRQTSCSMVEAHSWLSPAASLSPGLVKVVLPVFLCQSSSCMWW